MIDGEKIDKLHEIALKISKLSDELIDLEMDMHRDSDIVYRNTFPCGCAHTNAMIAFEGVAWNTPCKHGTWSFVAT